MGITSKVRGRVVEGSNSTTKLGDSADAILMNSVTLSATQVKGLYSTAQTLVPAPGAGKCISVVSIFAKLNFVTTAFAGANALEFRYDTAGGTKVTADMAAAFINSTATAYRKVSAIITDMTPRVNAPIVANVPTADPTQGLGSMTIKTFYHVVAI